MAERRELAREVRVDGGQRFRVPDPLADVHQAGSGSVSVFHGSFPGEAEIEVIVGEQDGRQPGEVFRLSPLEPEDLGGCETDGQADAELLDGLFSPQTLDDEIRLRRPWTCRSRAWPA